LLHKSDPSCEQHGGSLKTQGLERNHPGKRSDVVTAAQTQELYDSGESAAKEVFEQEEEMKVAD
jgi:hypothetical protein